jgi:hypothetical protein
LQSQQVIKVHCINLGGFDKQTRNCSKSKTRSLYMGSSGQFN